MPPGLLNRGLGSGACKTAEAMLRATCSQQQPFIPMPEINEYLSSYTSKATLPPFLAQTSTIVQSLACQSKPRDLGPDLYHLGCHFPTP